MTERGLELSLGVTPELVDAIAEAVAAKLAGQLPQAEGGESWRLWDVVEVCERLGRSERTVRKWTASGALPHIHLDEGAKAYDPDDVKAFARARRIPLKETDESATPPRKLKAVGKSWLDE